MPLTGPFIESEIATGRIGITPFDPRRVGPDSVDLHLHHELRYYDTTDGPLDMRRENRTVTATIGSHGYLMQPGRLYLGRTVEFLETDHYMPVVEGRSSVARLGICVHQTAGFTHVGFRGTLTLEIVAVEPVVIYTDEPFCQVYFLRPEGEIRLYSGRYQGQVDATPSRLHLREVG